MKNTPNAEKYVLEADAMRRRQLRSALLHGRRRTWREHARAWPAVAVGLICVAVILAGLAVMGAVQKSKENERKQEQMQQRQMQQPPPSPAPTVTVTPTPTTAPGRGNAAGRPPKGGQPKGGPTGKHHTPPKRARR